MNDSKSVNIVQRSTVVIVALLAFGLAGCKPPGNGSAGASSGPAAAFQSRLEAVDLSNPIRPVALDQPIVLRAARNEWTSFTVRLSGVFAEQLGSVRITTGVPQVGSLSDAVSVY